MKVLIIYDSVFSNTEKIAQSIGNVLGSQKDVEILRINNVKIEQLTGVELLIVGSPTLGGRPTPAILDFFNEVSGATIKGLNVLAFDTRLSTKMVGIFGYAAGKISEYLENKGGTLLAPPEGFFVKGKKGPLKVGEIERAASWAQAIVESEK